MKRFFIVLCLILCLICSVPAIADSSAESVPPERPITIVGVGDIMLGSNYPAGSALPPDPLKDTRHLLKDATITVGNLEGTLFDRGGVPKKCANPAVCYVFRMPSAYGDDLKAAGFDFLSLANNHSNDFGLFGQKKTMQHLDQRGIHYAGLQEIAEFSVCEREGIRFGFAAFAPNYGTTSINRLSGAKQLIRKLTTCSDIVIVMFHGGAEGAKYQHIPRKNEIYCGENRGNVFAFARALVDVGADLVFGQGPHVTRAIERYKNRFISYSAGNFATCGRFNLKGPNGIAPIFKITVNRTGAFVSGEIISVKQVRGEGGPRIDPDHGAARKIISLNRSDFPEGNHLTVSPRGAITAMP